MAGRPLSHARFEAEKSRIEAARALPSEPRAEPTDYSPALIPELISLADLGLTEAEIAAHWFVTEDELKEWAKAHVEFRRAMAQARTRAKAWWERSARLAMAERDTRYPAGLFSHVMRARYPEYEEKTAATVHIDLGSLVVISRPEPPTERAVIEAKPLNVRESVKLSNSQTLGNGGSQADQTPCDDPGEAQADERPASRG